MRHGGIYLALKTEDIVQMRLKKWMWSITMIHLVFLSLGWWLSYKVGPSYHITSPIDWAQPSNPLLKMVEVRFDLGLNFSHYPWMLAAPLFAFGGIMLSEILFAFRLMGASFIFSSLSIFGIVSIPGLTLFPIILPSSSHPGHSLSIMDASSSHLTLFIMLIAAVIFVPLILSYTAWVYRVLRGKITESTLETHKHDYY
jgi:cytochrome d ubiquinol oxidase subunit II